MRHKFSNKVKQEIYDRDGGLCVLCGSNLIGPPHHTWWGAEAEYTKDANNANKGVLLCVNCHYDIHFGKDNGKRELCKEYLGIY